MEYVKRNRDSNKVGFPYGSISKSILEGFKTIRIQIKAIKITRAKIHQVDATLFVEQRLNNVVIKVQQHLLNSQC